MTIKISNGTPHLARAIDHVFMRTWLATYPNSEAGISKQDVISHFDNQKARLEKRKVKLGSLPENEQFLVAKEGNKVVGVCSAKRDDEKNELQAIYVLPEYQWRGIGRLLYESALAFFNTKLPIILEVATYNAGAISFYKKLGFSEHSGRFHTNNWHELKNGKRIPIVTMILERGIGITHPMPKTSRKIIAIGGGEIVPKNPQDVGTREIDQEIIRLTNKKHPKLLFIPTASHDAGGYVENIRGYFWNSLGCQVEALLLYGKNPDLKEIESKILSADIVYVGGGNTYRMMRLWRKYGVDSLLRQAWKNGAVMCGLSAGSICWFRHGHSDSRKSAPEDKKFKYMKVSGLGFVDALHCPHYDVEEYRRPELHKMMARSSGKAIAIDNCAAIEIIDDEYRIVSTRPEAKAYLVRKEDGAMVETEILKSTKFRPISELLA